MKKELYVLRISSNDDDTIGILYGFDCERIGITIEDEYRSVKVAGETRVQAGRYEISLRAEGGNHMKYGERFPDFHVGMLCIHNAPDWKIITPDMEFQYIQIEIGNTDDDTEGCLMVGSGGNIKLTGSQSISSSTIAYKRIYKYIVKELVGGHRVFINYIDNPVLENAAF